MPDENGDNITVPLNISLPNPNGEEFDNLYLDMNGIVRIVFHYSDFNLLADHCYP